VTNNLRLRASPSRDAETLAVIPFTTALDLVARTSDAAWFFTRYDGQEGWVDAQFLNLSASCTDVPVR
jgi:uncharacterized protein YraI